VTHGADTAVINALYSNKIIGIRRYYQAAII